MELTRPHETRVPKLPHFSPLDRLSMRDHARGTVLLCICNLTSIGSFVYGKRRFSLGVGE